MQNVAKPQRGRSMSMQDYDIPLRRRMNSAQMSSSPPISPPPKLSSSPPISEIVVQSTDIGQSA
jgi:hypothetical protein